MTTEHNCLSKLVCWQNLLQPVSAKVRGRAGAQALASLAEIFPYASTVDYYRSVGKHFVALPVLDTLSNLRRAVGDVRGSYPYAVGGTRAENSVKILSDFLDSSVDKHVGAYDYKSYIALSLIIDDTMPPSAAFDAVLDQRAHLLKWLLLDVFAFEGRSLLGQERLTQDRLDPDLVRQRLAATARALKGLVDCKLEGITWQYDEVEAIARLAARFEMGDDPGEPGVADGVDLCSLLLQRPSWGSIVPLDLLMHLSMLPVYTNHDEYVFIRILQGYEVLFNVLVHGLRLVISNVHDGALRAGTATLRALSEVFRAGFPLFRILKTMSRENFGIFRQFTEGASAIQSPQFKMIEVLMGRPSPARQESPAFTYVPSIRLLYERAAVSLEVLLADYAKACGGAGSLAETADPLLLDFLIELNRFDRLLLSWKKIHYRIAVHMIGQKKGTGGTDGVAYLNRFRDSLFFPALEDLLARRRLAEQRAAPPGGDSIHEAAAATRFAPQRA
jgi:tryptophan 2,3-dioxygenase